MENTDDSTLSTSPTADHDDVSHDNDSASLRKVTKKKTSFDHDDDKNPEVQSSRTNMAIVHFLLTVPKWSIGLFLFLASYTSPLTSPRSAIQEPIQRLQTLVRLESKSYQDCVTRWTARMEQLLEEVASNDRASLEEIYASNQKTIMEAQEIADICMHRTKKARQTLLKWRDDGMKLPWVEILPGNRSDGGTSLLSSCTAQKRNQTERLLEQDFRLYEDQVSSVMDTYVEDSQSSLRLVQSYASARFEYDWNYFVMDRIRPALDYLAEHSAHVQSFAISFDVDLSVIEAKFRETLVKIESTLKDVKRHIDILEAKLEEFAASIQDFHVAYDDLYDRFLQAIDFSIDLLPPGATLPIVFDISDVPIGEIYLPKSTLFWPELDMDYQDIHTMLDDAARECIIIMMDVLETVRAQAGQQLRGTVQELSRALADILELKDYAPPQFQGSHRGVASIVEELDIQFRRGEEARKSAGKALTNLRLKALNMRMNAPGFGGPEIGQNYSYIDNSTTFDYLALSFPNWSFPETLTKATMWMTENIWITEVAIQAYRLWKLESIYSRGAIPNMPEIDYGDDDDDTKQPQTKYMILSMVMKAILRPQLVVFVCFCLPICIIAFAFWFPHVHRSCKTTSNGTFLARHFLSPILINQANAPGNSHYLHAEFTCRKSQRRLCTEIGTDAEARHHTDWSTLRSLQMGHNESLEALGLIGDCLDVYAMTAMMKNSCCGLKGYGSTGCLASTDLVCPIDTSTTPPSAFWPLSKYMTEPACQERLFEWNLTDARYDCSSLFEVCGHIPCAGVNKELIRSHTIRTDCKIEMYAIDCCHFLLAVFLHAICVNLICTLVFNGLRHIQWRRVCPSGIKLRTRLRENGELAKGFELEDRSDRIDKAIRRFELVGKLQIGAGVVLFMGYTISTLTLVVKNSKRS